MGPLVGISSLRGPIDPNVEYEPIFGFAFSDGAVAAGPGRRTYVPAPPSKFTALLLPAACSSVGIHESQLQVSNKLRSSVPLPFVVGTRDYSNYKFSSIRSVDFVRLYRNAGSLYLANKQHTN